MGHVFVAFALLALAIVALGPSRAVTQKAAMTTQINVITPCNTWGTDAKA